MTALAWFVSVFIIGIPMIIGYFVLYVGMRCKKSAGSKLDLTAFWFNFLGWIWMWAERIEEIVEKHPHWKQDLSEILGYRPDDGRIT